MRMIRVKVYSARIRVEDTSLSTAMGHFPTDNRYFAQLGCLP
jgi:hypothetical protein